MTATPNAGLGSLAFKGLKDAKARSDANYCRPGVYWAKINKTKLDKSRKGEIFLANEMTIVRVLDERLAEQPPGRKGHIVGEDVTHMSMQKHEVFLGNLKAMIGNIMEMDPNTVTEEHAEKITGPDQPLQGTVVEISVKVITTKKGLPIFVVSYVREVKSREVLDYLNALPNVADLKARFFPNNYLENMVAAEEAATKKA